MRFSKEELKLYVSKTDFSTLADVDRGEAYKIGGNEMDLHEETLKGRPLYEIAALIYRDWKPINYAAKPYVDAMSSLEDMNSKYICDDARSIVTYFLSNAQTWRGPVAKMIKAELNRRVKK